MYVLKNVLQFGDDMKNIAVLTSGGDSPGMNAAIRSIVRSGIEYGFNVFGIKRGYEGLLNEEIITLTKRDVGGIIQRGGTILGSSRCLQFKELEYQQKAYDILKKHHIDGLVVIGGDGSMAGARALGNLGLNTMTIPGTIDNDMCGTERTIGFDTTLNTIIEAVNKIRDTIASHARVAVVEVMGRHSGHLALNAGLACGAEVVLLPEASMDLKKMCEELYDTERNGKSYSIVLVAEGAYTGYEVYQYLKDNTHFDPTVTVLGYIQRGGSPSAQDNILAAQMGEAAIQAFLSEKRNSLIGYVKGEIVVTPYEEAFNLAYPIDSKDIELLRILAS